MHWIVGDDLLREYPHYFLAFTFSIHTRLTCRSITDNINGLILVPCCAIRN